MNNFKNFVIFILSLIILVQAAFLMHFISQREPEKRKKGIAQKVLPKLEKIPSEIKPVPAVTHLPQKVEGKIVIILDDWGYNLKNRDFITDNDYHVTISILPFREYSTQIAKLAHLNNKDVIVHMPMEPHNKENYGLEENTLLTTMDKKTLTHWLDAAFEVVPYAKGLNNHMGSKATEDMRLMTVVLEYLKEKHLFFLDSLVTSHTVGRGLARKLRMAFAQRDVFIDNENDPFYIRDQLHKLAERAKQMGFAVGIGHDRPVTVAVLEDLIPKLEKDGYQFVYLSEVVQIPD